MACPRETGCAEQCQTARPCSSPPVAVRRNADGNVSQAGTLQTLTQGAGSTNPQTNSYQLRKSEQRGCCHSFGPTTTAVPGTSASLPPLIPGCSRLQCKANLGWAAFFKIFSSCQSPSCQIQVNRPKTQMSILDWVSHADWMCSEQLLRSKHRSLSPGWLLSTQAPIASGVPRAAFVSIAFHAPWFDKHCLMT